MSKKIYLFSLLWMAFAFAACSETEEVGRYDNWQARSVAFMDSLSTVYKSDANKALPDTDANKLFAVLDETNQQLIYYKKISKTGDSQKRPVYTSKVSCYYRMSYINGDIVQENFKGAEPTDFDIPSEFFLNQLISGWSNAMPYMTEGEFWTLYIPYQSGYDSGTGSDGSLQPYSALVYQVKLHEIIEH